MKKIQILQSYLLARSTSIIPLLIMLSACGGKIDQEGPGNKKETDIECRGEDCPGAVPVQPSTLDPWIEERLSGAKSKDPRRNVLEERPGARHVVDDKDVVNPGVGSNTDDDTKINPDDNCPYDTNEDQNDRDHDGIGDVCDICPDAPNSDQRNICNPTLPKFEGTQEAANKWHKENDDADGDGLPDFYDICPKLVNALKKGAQPGSKNKDDYIFPSEDKDNDGIPDLCDNCPGTSNPDQKKSDPNSVLGDACRASLVSAKCQSKEFCIENKQGSDCIGGQCVCGNQNVELDRIKPNVVLILDVSGSMDESFGLTGKSRMESMKEALNSFAESAYKDFRFSILEFGNKTPYKKWLKVITYWDCIDQDRLNWLTPGDVKYRDYSSANALKGVWNKMFSQCFTPTAEAILEVKRAYEAGELSDNANGRKTVAILVTDGKPSTGDLKAVNAAKALYEAGVELYVVGMDVKTSVLEKTAVAGSGNTRKDYLRPKDGEALVKMIDAIATVNAKCSMTLKTNSDTEKVYVNVNGRALSREFSTREFTYDKDSHLLVLNENACKELNSVAKPSLEVMLGCDVCVADLSLAGKDVNEREMGMCDGVDNDCDGVVDESCDECKLFEICNNHIDDDCDGVVDNGCASVKKKLGEDCDRDSDCEQPLECVFNPELKKKVCTKPCVSIGGSCGGDDVCCGGFACTGTICSIG